MSGQIDFIDTHTHLFVKKFHDDIDEVIERSKNSGVRHCFLPNIDEQSIDDVFQLAAQYPGYCFPMMGLHPCSVDEDYPFVLDKLNDLIANQEVYGIGETGIDLYWDKRFREEQIKAFEVQIEWAKEYDLPIIIHSRAALDLTIEIIDSHMGNNLKGIFHCFDGNEAQGRKIVDLGFYLGIGGIITYKNSHLPEVLEELPLSSMVLETDSPYLPPHPHRGKRNESSFIPLVAEKLASVKQAKIEDIARVTSQNAGLLFGLAKK